MTFCFRPFRRISRKDGDTSGRAAILVPDGTDSKKCSRVQVGLVLEFRNTAIAAKECSDLRLGCEGVEAKDYNGGGRASSDRDLCVPRIWWDCVRGRPVALLPSLCVSTQFDVG